MSLDNLRSRFNSLWNDLLLWYAQHTKNRLFLLVGAIGVPIVFGSFVAIALQALWSPPANVLIPIKLAIVLGYAMLSLDAVQQLSTKETWAVVTAIVELAFFSSTLYGILPWIFDLKAGVFVGLETLPFEARGVASLMLVVPPLLLFIAIFVSDVPASAPTVEELDRLPGGLPLKDKWSISSSKVLMLMISRRQIRDEWHLTSVLMSEYAEKRLGIKVRAHIICSPQLGTTIVALPYKSIWGKVRSSIFRINLKTDSLDRLA